MKRKEVKIAEAKERQAAYAGRTPQENLARLDRAGMQARKERAKLEARIAAPKKGK